MSTEKKSVIPMKLQFFADPTPGSAPDPTPAPDPKPNPTPTPANDPKPDEHISPEDQMQQLRVELAKMKKSFDTAASEAAGYKKQLRAKQSEDEIAAQEKAEKEAAREAEYESLKKENEVNKLTKNFLKLGYSEDLAEKAAVAQYENDADALFQIQSTHQESLVKEKQAEWLKSRPAAMSGATEEDGFQLTKEQFNRMGYLQRVELKNKHPKIYEQLTR